MPVLDSNLLIRLDDEDPVAVRTLRRIEKETLVVPYQTALEYACGTSDPELALDDIQSAFTLQRPELETLQEAVKLAAQTRKKGLRFRGGDTWIAACASLRSDYVVTTNKRDFSQLGVPAWNYEKEQQPPTA